MKDVMLDFETLGNGKNACVIQVGAVYFNRYTGEIGDVFKRNVDARSAVKSGAEIDADTVYWWLKQSKDAIESILHEPLESIEAVFKDLNMFLVGVDCIWSHATFDFVILIETYKRLGYRKMNFSYRSARDIRTLCDLADVNTKNFQLDRKGIAHDALDDCIHQVRYCSEAFRKLQGAK